MGFAEPCRYVLLTRYTPSGRKREKRRLVRKKSLEKSQGVQWGHGNGVSVRRKASLAVPKLPSLQSESC